MEASSGTLPELPAWMHREAYKLGDLLEKTGAEMKRMFRAGSRGNESFRVGELVVIGGLTRRATLNGEFARVQSIPSPLDVEGRYEVAILREDVAETVSVKAANLSCADAAPVVPCTYVVLHSLRSRPSLNGQSAKVLRAPDETSGNRYHVELSDGEVVAVKRDSILPQAHAAWRPGSSESKRSQCCICLTVDREMTAAVPCGHLCVCTRCSCSLRTGSPCPICRRPVDQFMQVFASGG